VRVTFDSVHPSHINASTVGYAIGLEPLLLPGPRVVASMRFVFLGPELGNR